MSRALPLRRKRNSGIRSFTRSCESIFGVMFDDDTDAPLPLQAELATNKQHAGLQRFQMILWLPSADLIRPARGVWHYFRERRLCQARTAEHAEMAEHAENHREISRFSAISVISACSAFFRT